MSEDLKLKVNLSDELHAVFTKHGIASRTEMALVNDVIRWAAQAWRQTPRPFQGADELALTLLDGQEPPKEGCTGVYHLWQGPPVGSAWEPDPEQQCLCGMRAWRERELPRRAGYKIVRSVDAPEQALKEPQKAPSLNDFSGPLNTRERLLHRRCQRAESDVERLTKRERVAQDALYEITQRWTKAVEIREQQRKELAALTQRLTAVEQERDAQWCIALLNSLSIDNVLKALTTFKETRELAEPVAALMKQLEAHAAALIALREKIVTEVRRSEVEDGYGFVWSRVINEWVTELTAMIERKE